MTSVRKILDRPAEVIMCVMDDFLEIDTLDECWLTGSKEQQQPCINVAEERFHYYDDVDVMVHVVSTTEIQLQKTNHITLIFIKINEGKKVWQNHNRLTWNKSFSLVDDLKDRRRDEMDNKKNSQRHKRQIKTLEENYWDCSVCTYRNTAEAFKCAMCDVRKGTSTRKPRLNPQLVAQQVAQQLTASTPKPRSDGSKERKSVNNSTGNSEEKIKKKKIRNIRPRLKNVDRSQVYRQPVTVNNVTVVITEFLPKSVASSSQNSTVLPTDIPSSSDVSNHSEVSVNGEVPPTPQSS